MDTTTNQTTETILYSIKSTFTPEDHDREGRHTSASMIAGAQSSYPAPI